MPSSAPSLFPPKALLFDWDSTLVDNWQSIVHAVNTTLVAMGQAAWTAEEARARVRESMRDAFPRLFGERWPEARKIFYDTFAARHLEHLTPLPGAEAMLAELSEAGLYLAIVSNKTGALLRKEVAHLGWNRYFGRVVGAGDAERDKPDPAPVALALAGSETPPGPVVWLVGDTALDMACAISAGCVPVLIAGNGLEYDDFSAWPPSCTVSDCAALAALVRRF
ncbi:MAG TPA: HAD family hydrolase [Alphaproteobacteria bacterium]|nr:HAD family hydrolase [Alphaproteobacteria bacterium]